MSCATAKKVTVDYTLKEGEKFIVDGVEIEIRRKRRHESQVRIRVRYPKKLDGDIDTHDKTA